MRNRLLGAVACLVMIVAGFSTIPKLTSGTGDTTSPVTSPSTIIQAVASSPDPMANLSDQVNAHHAELEAQRLRQLEAQRAAERAARAKSTRTARPSVTNRTAPPRPTGDIWWRLALCESGGRNVNTGNGYYGYFQFSAPTWRSVGMSGLPHEYDYGTQLAAAQRLQARSGWGQWPACSRKLGLR